MYFCLCYHFEISTAGTTGTLLEIGDGTTCQLCFRRGSSEAPCILQGVCAVPIFMVLRLGIQAQNPIKTQNEDYEKKE